MSRAVLASSKKVEESWDLDCTLSGTTLTVIVEYSGCLHVAHCGDSRAVLAKGSKGSRKFTAMDLLNEHKADDEDEKRRIEASGGEVARKFEGDMNYRVFLKGKQYPGLAMTRSIGDTVGRPAGIIAEPTCSKFPIESDFAF